MTTHETKSIGMWAHPQVKTTSSNTDSEESIAVTSTATLTSPVKAASVITQTSPLKEQPIPVIDKPSPSPVLPEPQPGPSKVSSSSSSSSSSPPPSNDDPVYDPTLEPGDSSDVSGSSDKSDEQDCSRHKYIIFNDCLDELLRRCPGCGELVIETKKSFQGSLLSVTLVCGNNHTTHWKSQPIINRFAEGNIVLSAAVFFAGGTYGRFYQICSFMGLKVPSSATFFRIQKEFLYPVVNEYWLAEKEAVKQELQELDSVSMIGDARCDSPGYSAKYSTYTFMDAATDKIIDFEVMQVSEVCILLLDISKVCCYH